MGPTALSTSLEERVTALETHIAHSEATIQDLSDMIARQWQIIDRLTLDLGNLKDYLRQIDTAKSPQDDKPPPHY